MSKQEDINKNWFNVCSDLMAQIIDLRMQLNAAKVDAKILDEAQASFVWIKQQAASGLQMLAGPQGDIDLDLLETLLSDISTNAEMALNSIDGEEAGK